MATHPPAHAQPCNQPYLHYNPQEDQHLVLDGDTLNFQEKPLTSIATGSLQNKIFPPHKEIYKTLREAITTWTKKNSLPSMMHSDLEALWNHSRQVHNACLHDHITHEDVTRFKQLFPDAVFHNEDKRATSLRIFCPLIYYECLTNTFSDPLVFRKLDASPNTIIDDTIAEITKQFGKAYPWALVPDVTSRMPTSSQNGKTVSLWPPNCEFLRIAKLIYQLLPEAFPHNLAKETSSTSSSSSKTQILIASQLPKSTTRTLRAFSLPSIPLGFWTAGASPFTTFHRL